MTDDNTTQAAEADGDAITVKPVVGDNPASKLRREVCTMGGCAEFTESCFCEELSDREAYIQYQSDEIKRLNSLIAAHEAREKELVKALKPFARVGWMTSDTEMTARTVIAHMHPERSHEIILNSNDFYGAAKAVKGE